MSKILIIGAGNAQIDAISYCQAKGHEVYGCSYSDADKGVPLLDHFKQIDIKDVQSIERYVLDEKIEYVYSVGSDLAMPTVTKVSEDINLPHFNSFKTAEVCQSKHLMREALGNKFIGNAEYLVCRNVEEAIQCKVFPSMMKPVDSQGQRGCYKVNDVKDIKTFFEKSLSYSKSGNVIIEKYIEGPEVSVNGFVVGGKLKFALMSDRVVFDEFPGGIIKEHLIPTRYPEAKVATLDLVNRVIQKLSILDGPFYAQIKLDKGNPVLLEITPRLDGCHMWNLIKYSCGVDLLDLTFSYLFGEKELDFSSKTNEKDVKLSFMCEVPNQRFDRLKYNIQDSLYNCWYYETGDIVRELNGYMEKGGYQITLVN